MLLTGHKAAVHSVKFDPSGEFLCSGSFDKNLYVWNTYGHCDVTCVLSGHKNAILDLAWSGDGAHVYSASADKTVSIWDPETGYRVKKFTGHSAIINCLASVRRGPSLLCSGSDDGTVKVWDARTRREAHSFPHKYQITSCAFADGGDMLYAGCLDNEIYGWDIRKGEISMTLSGHGDTVTGLSISPNGHFLLSNSMDNTVRSWDIRPFCAGSRQKQTYTGAAHGFQKLLLRCAWDKDGARVAAGSSDHTVNVWDFESGAVLYRLPGHKGSVNEVAFSPMEPIIASASSDHNIFLGELSND